MVGPWKLYIDSPQKRALHSCGGSLTEGGGCGYGWGNGVGEGCGGGVGYAWGDGDGWSVEKW